VFVLQRETRKTGHNGVGWTCVRICGGSGAYDRVTLLYAPPQQEENTEGAFAEASHSPLQYSHWFLPKVNVLLCCFYALWSILGTMKDGTKVLPTVGSSF
jgi:hypothetical protein